MTRYLFVLLVAALVGWPAHARGQQVSSFAQSGTNLTIPVGNAPIVHMQLRSATLSIRTWDRAEISLSSTQPLQARHFGARAIARALPEDVTILSTQVQSPQGALTLPPESFSLGTLLDSSHDGVQIRGGAALTVVTLTVPNSTAFVWASIGRGVITMQGYKNGAFVVLVHNGNIRLRNVSGAGYVEVARGPILIANSAFDRIRARTAAGRIVFEKCNARQIEVSSIQGGIAYDNGTFVPGLAHFETRSGDIALGVASGGAQIGAHSANGRVYSDFRGGANVRGSQTGDAQATVNGGGPVVTASSTRGNVYLYDGAFRSHPRMRRALSKRLQQKPPHRGHI